MSGIAGNYIKDSGIATHPSVLFHENFESGNFTTGGWTMFPSTVASITATAANVHTGTRAADLVCPKRTNSGGELSKALRTSWPRTLLFLRCYIRFDPNWDLGTAVNNHCGISIRNFANVPGGGLEQPNGTNFYGVTSQPSELNAQNQIVFQPAGPVQHYTYHMDQTSQFGTITRGLTTRQLGVGVWQHFEQMLKVNDVGVANGEVKTWVDSVLVRHDTGRRFRSVSTLLPDRIWLRNYIHNNSVRINHIYFDNIVLATKYVGPMRMS